MSIYGGLKAGFEAAGAVAGGTIKGSRDTMRASGAVAEAEKASLITPAKRFASTKTAQHALYPALVGTGVGVGGYTALTGISAGIKGAGVETAKEGAKALTGILLLGGLVVLGAWAYQKVKK